MNFSRTKIILGTWITIFVIMTSFLVFEYLKLQKTEEYTQKLQQENIQETESVRSFDSLAKTVSNIKEDSEKANGYFIKREEVVNFLDTIESLGSTTKTKISIQSVNDKKNASSSSLLSVALNAKGTYSNLYYLIRMLEELPYQSEIQSIRLTNGFSGDKKEALGWSLDIIIVGLMF
jgi:hypothetical protein